MTSIETTGRSVQEATQAAAKQLGVGPERLEAHVLEESKGLFGRVSVRIRATVKQEAPEATPQQEKPQRRTPTKKASAPVEQAEPAQSEPEPVRTPPKRGLFGRLAPKAPPAQPEVPAAPKTAVQVSKSGAGAFRKSPLEERKEDTEAEQHVEVIATPADAEQLAELVREILRLGDLDVDVKPAGMNGRYVNLELDGQDVAFVVGKRGEVLDAFQYLVNVISSRQIKNGVRATLDGNNYRRRREEALAKYCMGIAEQVRDRKEEAVLDALPAFERRIVHKVLEGFEGVQTYSEGEEPDRRVVIAPA